MWNWREQYFCKFMIYLQFLHFFATFLTENRKGVRNIHFWSIFLVSPEFCLKKKVEVDLEGGKIPKCPNKIFEGRDKVTIINIMCMPRISFMGAGHIIFLRGVRIFL